MKYVLVAILCVLGAVTVRSQILVEVYRNIDCANCRQPDDGLEQYVAQNPNLKATIVYFHTDFPSPVDPFYLASKDDVSHRFYDVYQQSSTPVSAVDGFVAGTTLSSWKQVINAAPELATDVVVSAADTNGIITIQMQVTGSGGTQVRPYVMLLESGIIYDNQKSYGKLASWDNIFRAMIPTKDGGTAFALGGTQTFTYKYDVTGKGFNESNLSVVAFVQDVDPQAAPNNTSYLVEGFTTASVVSNAAVTPGPTLGTELGMPSPNPATSYANVPFTLARSGLVEITVSDALGREVATIANAFFGEGSNTAVFAPAVHTPGLYVVTMSVDGVVVGSKKIVLQ